MKSLMTEKNGAKPNEVCPECFTEPCYCGPDDPEEADFEEDDDYIDCGMMHDGLCGKAGSEECDECPYNVG